MSGLIAQLWTVIEWKKRAASRKRGWRRGQSKQRCGGQGARRSSRRRQAQRPPELRSQEELLRCECHSHSVNALQAIKLAVPMNSCGLESTSGAAVNAMLSSAQHIRSHLHLLKLVIATRPRSARPLVREEPKLVVCIAIVENILSPLVALVLEPRYEIIIYKAHTVPILAPLLDQRQVIPVDCYARTVPGVQ